MKLEKKIDMYVKKSFNYIQATDPEHYYQLYNRWELTIDIARQLAEYYLENFNILDPNVKTIKEFLSKHFSKPSNLRPLNNFIFYMLSKQFYSASAIGVGGKIPSIGKLWSKKMKVKHACITLHHSPFKQDGSLGEVIEFGTGHLTEHSNLEKVQGDLVEVPGIVIWALHASDIKLKDSCELGYRPFVVDGQTFLKCLHDDVNNHFNFLHPPLKQLDFNIRQNVPNEALWDNELEDKITTKGEGKNKNEVTYFERFIQKAIEHSYAVHEIAMIYFDMILYYASNQQYLNQTIEDEKFQENIKKLKHINDEANQDVKELSLITSIFSKYTYELEKSTSYERIEEIKDASVNLTNKITQRMEKMALWSLNADKVLQEIKKQFMPDILDKLKDQEKNFHAVHKAFNKSLMHLLVLKSRSITSSMPPHMLLFEQSQNFSALEFLDPDVNGLPEGQVNVSKNKL